MNSAHRIIAIASLFLTAAMVAPVSLMAATPQEAAVLARVYDPGHKDYHNWDDNNENRAWGVYLTDNHLKDHQFAKAPKAEQSRYWKWRHEHPDDKK